jgi:hypothetical protein
VQVEVADDMLPSPTTAARALSPPTGPAARASRANAVIRRNAYARLFTDAEEDGNANTAGSDASEVYAAAATGRVDAQDEVAYDVLPAPTTAARS